MSELRFVPIPTPGPKKDLRYLWETRQHWMPFIAHIAKRGDENVEVLVDEILTGQVQIALITDDENKAHALIGWRLREPNGRKVAELIWTTGIRMKQWRDLLPDLHAYLKDHLGCETIKPICRPGWSRFLRKHGYRVTHYMMELQL